MNLIRKLEEMPAYIHAMEGYVYGFPIPIKLRKNETRNACFASYAW